PLPALKAPVPPLPPLPPSPAVTELLATVQLISVNEPRLKIAPPKALVPGLPLLPLPPLPLELFAPFTPLTPFVPTAAFPLKVQLVSTSVESASMKNAPPLV